MILSDIGMTSIVAALELLSAVVARKRWTDAGPPAVADVAFDAGEQTDVAAGPSAAV